MELLIIGLVTAFNFIVIYWKFKKNRISDAVLDLSIFAVISFMFAGTISGLTVGMISSFVVSLYLLFNPPFKEALNGNV